MGVFRLLAPLALAVQLRADGLFSSDPFTPGESHEITDRKPMSKAEEEAHPCKFYERFHNLLYQQRTTHKMRHRVMKAKKTCGSNSDASWTYGKWKHKWPGSDGSDNDLYCMNRCCVGQIHELVRAAFSTTPVDPSQWTYEHPLMRFLPGVMGSRQDRGNSGKSIDSRVHGYCKDNSATMKQKEKDAAGGVHDICMQYIAQEKCQQDKSCASTQRENAESLYTHKDFMVRLCFCWIPCYYWDKTAAQKKLTVVVKSLLSIAPNKFQRGKLHSMYPDMESSAPTLMPTKAPTNFERYQYDPNLVKIERYPKKYTVANANKCGTSGAKFSLHGLRAKLGDKLKVSLLVHVSKGSIDPGVLEKSDQFLLLQFDEDQVAGTYKKTIDVTIGDGTSTLFLDEGDCKIVGLFMYIC
jgi:hypothetical protein